MSADLDALVARLKMHADVLSDSNTRRDLVAEDCDAAAIALLALREELANVNAGAADVVLALAVCNKARRAAEAERDEARRVAGRWRDEYFDNLSVTVKDAGEQFPWEPGP